MKGYPILLKQAAAQSATVLKSSPARLYWYVQDHLVFRHLSEVFLANKLPIQLFHKP